MATETQCLGLLRLPPEILINIVSSDALQDADVCRLSQVCVTLHKICSSSEVWKAKFIQRWSHTDGAIYEQLTPGEWYELYKICKLTNKKVQQAVEKLAVDNYWNTDVSNEDFMSFIQIEQLHRHGKAFVMSDLNAILNSEGNYYLTDKYYAQKAFAFMHHRIVKAKLKDFLQESAEEQALEKGAFLVAAFLNLKGFILDESSSAVYAELDCIANKVRETLRSDCSDHPACFKDNAITGFKDSLWTPQQCRQVLDTINKVLYEQLGFEPNTIDYTNVKNSCIDQVLQRKTGIPITLSIVYSAVARRLGVVCEPVNFPTHFLLRWKEHPMAVGLSQYTFIDAFNRGRARTSQQCHEELRVFGGLGQEIFAATTPVKVLERMARNIVSSYARTDRFMDDRMTELRDALELYLAIKPNDHQMRLLQAQVFMQLSINPAEVSDAGLIFSDEHGGLALQGGFMMVQNLLARGRNLISQQPLGVPELMSIFDTKISLEELRYDYMCVIYGWDRECKASQEWIIQMGVNRLPKKQYQPFYNVLVFDGSNRYSAQENLLYTHDVLPITHSEVGKYFQEFTGRYYVPNSCLGEDYPDDLAVTQTLVDRYFASGE